MWVLSMPARLWLNGRIINNLGELLINAVSQNVIFLSKVMEILLESRSEA